VEITSSTAGGIFDPAGFSKGDMASLKLKEIKNARLAMLVRLVTESCIHGNDTPAAVREHILDARLCGVAGIRRLPCAAHRDGHHTAS
jgi:Chlorophyll A-B binding protein